ncbi:MAG: EF-hand domain-containing protein [Sphingosinicella sp.]|nr:EF-hand domain-containing protein [Sphingosinicella sp.]
MKKLLIAGVAAAALISVPALALQQAQGRTAAQPLSRAAVQANVQARFAKADADRDGFITKAEVEARAGATRQQRQAKRGDRRAETFARLDANKDGSISRAEFDARPARGENRAERRNDRQDRRGARMERRGERHAMRGGRFGAGMIDRADTNRDGRVSLAEASSVSLARFDRLDANKDGIVTPEERRAARQLMRGQRQGQPNG